MGLVVKRLGGGMTTNGLWGPAPLIMRMVKFIRLDSAINKTIALASRIWNG